MTADGNILALSGGVGGAKLALGLSNVLSPAQLTIVANTGDDFSYLGLHISPDIDSILYALAGVNNRETGWGRDSETWSFMAELERLGIESWFRLGDRDLVVHLYRSDRLRTEQTLSGVTTDLAQRFGIGARIVPMTDDVVGTIVETDAGSLSFQNYFVRYRCQPKVSRVTYDGADDARMSPGFLEALSDPQLAGIVICPSNPWLSIDPILSLPGAAAAIAGSPAPVIAVSPIVQGRAIKGPTAKIMGELGIAESALSVAEHYHALIDGFILDTLDEAVAPSVARLGIDVELANTVMQTLNDRISLAGRAVAHLARLRGTDLR